MEGVPEAGDMTENLVATLLRTAEPHGQEESLHRGVEGAVVVLDVAYLETQVGAVLQPVHVIFVGPECDFHHRNAQGRMFVSVAREALHFPDFEFLDRFHEGHRQ